MSSTLENIARVVSSDPTGWWVFVVPTDGQATETRKTLASILPPNASFSGRTALLETGTKLSVVCASDDVFENPFTAMFLGWDEGKSSDLVKWQVAATKVETFAS